VVAKIMQAEGMNPDPGDVIVTTGGQQALDLIAKALVDPGDPIICEGPTYPGAVPVFCSYEADTHHVSLDEEGMVIDELIEVLDRLDAEGRRPKFIYTVPTFSNPGGVTMSAERRARLVELAREREVLVVEDNPYGMLRYEGESPPTLYSLDGGDYVIYVGTLSKILSPGIRIGWCVAPPPVMAKLVLGKQAGDLCTSTLTQYFALEFFESDRWLGYVKTLCDHYRSRRDAMLEALERFFPPQAEWTRPEGGLFLWATLPAFINTTDLLAAALRENVAFVPGEGAFVDGRGTSSMRLNFSAQTEDEIREGIRRIGKVISEQVGLYESITGEQTAVHELAEEPSEGQRARILPLPRRRKDAT
jgi:2-aminoadipate transaminase